MNASNLTNPSASALASSSDVPAGAVADSGGADAASATECDAYGADGKFEIYSDHSGFKSAS